MTPEAVTLWRSHEMVVPSDEAIGRPEWHEERVADESYAYPDAEYVATPAAQYAALVAERDALRADLADLASGRVAIHELIVRNGKIDATFGGEMVQEIGLVFVDAYRKAGAVNYLEMTFHGKTEAGELERFTMTIQRVNGKTPHECRVEAERERDAARTALGAERGG